MMLASPLYPAPPFTPQSNSEDTLQYRPTRDIEAFNSLLPPPIEFIEGSSSGALAVPEGKYEPINTTPKAQKADHHDSHKQPLSTPVKPVHTPAIPSNAKGASLYPGFIDTTWPQTCNIGNGLYNTGNTCFLNSALQCLLHTPPLLRVILAHSKNECRVKNGFCMSCALREVTVKSHGAHKPFTPQSVSGRLQTIAKHMRKGRQEDSHEFLRYAIDALQKSCLAGQAPKIDPKLAETTWVHKIFGGRLRSRVTCRDCGHNSDTFDSILDLSLDIHNMHGLKEVLRKFVAVDYLKGADKYKCEKCKRPVNAEKRFTMHEAPVVLTVHLKRFSPLGRKIGHHINYDEQISLQSIMSEGRYGPTYSLYGVICHAGGGPNSGHYYAYVKSKDGRWSEMNDETVTSIRGAPVGAKHAYILFYLRNKGQGLEAAVNPTSESPNSQKGGVAAGMKKRKFRLDGDTEEVETEDKGVKIPKPFIGPLLPSPLPNGTTSDLKRQKPNPSDPQAAMVKKKIEATAANKAKKALSSLEGYTSDSDEGAEKGDAEQDSAPTAEATPVRSSPPPPIPPSSSPAPATSPIPVPSSSFYSTSDSVNGKKRKSPESESRSLSELKKYAQARIPHDQVNGSHPIPHKSPLGRLLNPYSRLSSGKSQTYQTYGHKKKGKARGF